MKNDNGRIESLQALRAIAFIGIITWHCRVTNLGGWGVSIFLILSGFVLMYHELTVCVEGGGKLWIIRKHKVFL